MPQILIVTDSTESSGEVVYRERLDAVHLDSEHSRQQLAERLAWAVGDAERAKGPGLAAAADPREWMMAGWNSGSRLPSASPSR